MNLSAIRATAFSNRSSALSALMVVLPPLGLEDGAVCVVSGMVSASSMANPSGLVASAMSDIRPYAGGLPICHHSDVNNAMVHNS